MTSGENAVSWGLADFDEMTDEDIVGWYETFIDTLTERNDAFEKAMKNRKGRG